MRLGLFRLLGLSPLLALGGCLAPFTTPSAYEEHTYLCEDEAAWREAVDACAARLQGDHGCHGALSLAGTLLGEPLQLSMQLPFGQLDTLALPRQDGQEEVLLSRAEGAGLAPYFHLTLLLGSIGGAMPSGPRRLGTDEAAELRPDGLRDGIASLALRFAAGGQREVLFARAGSGEIVVEAPSEARLNGRFQGAFGGAAEVMRGCFVLFADDVRVGAAP